MIWGYGRLSREIKGVIGSTVHVCNYNVFDKHKNSFRIWIKKYVIF